MIKKIGIVLLLLSITIVAGIFFFRKKWSKDELKIVATNTDIQDHLSNPQLIKKWLKPFSNTDTIILNKQMVVNEDTLTILNSNLLRTEWLFSKGNQQQKIIFKILPTDEGHTRVMVFSYSSLFEKYFKNSFQKKYHNDILFINDFLSSPKLQYGLDIEEGKVTDTLFLVINSETSKQKLQTAISDNYKKLLSYCNSNALGFNGVKLIHEKIIDSSKIQLYTAIGISRFIDTKDEKEIKFSQMPKGNMLYCKYNGLFGNRHETIMNIIRYASKAKYQSMALPFEKLKDTAFDFDPDKKVELTICYPIY